MNNLFLELLFVLFKCLYKVIRLSLMSPVLLISRFSIVATGIARAVSPAGSIRNVHYNLTPGSSRTLPPTTANIASSTNELVDAATVNLYMVRLKYM